MHTLNKKMQNLIYSFKLMFQYYLRHVKAVIIMTALLKVTRMILLDTTQQLIYPNRTVTVNKVGCPPLTS